MARDSPTLRNRHLLGAGAAATVASVTFAGIVFALVVGITVASLLITYRQRAGASTPCASVSRMQSVEVECSTGRTGAS